MAVVSYAGHQKEAELGAAVQELDLKLGLALAVMCGIFSSGMSFAIDAAKPIAAAAQHLGVNPALRRAAQLCAHHGRWSGHQPELLLYPAGIQKGAFSPRRLGAAARNTVSEWFIGRSRRNHVVPPVLLLRLGRSQHSAAPQLRELDAAHEHLRALRRACRARAGRMGRSAQTPPSVCCGQEFSLSLPRQISLVWAWRSEQAWVASSARF